MNGSESTISLMRSDVAAWAQLWAPGTQNGHGWRTALRLGWGYTGLRATLLYRLSHGLRRRGVKALPQLLAQINIMLHGLDIPPHVPIGPRLYIPHPTGTVVTARVVGSDVTLVSGVTIGMRNTVAFPSIGDHVYIGAGARVLGEINIGDHVSIGANAVVLADVPANSVAIGVPATIRAAKGAAPLNDAPERLDAPGRSAPAGVAAGPGGIYV